jgi:hypothetical protein
LTDALGRVPPYVLWTLAICVALVALPWLLIAFVWPLLAFVEWPWISLALGIAVVAYFGHASWIVACALGAIAWLLYGGVQELGRIRAANYCTADMLDRLVQAVDRLTGAVEELDPNGKAARKAAREDQRQRWARWEADVERRRTSAVEAGDFVSPAAPRGAAAATAAATSEPPRIRKPMPSGTVVERFVGFFVAQFTGRTPKPPRGT